MKNQMHLIWLTLILILPIGITGCSVETAHAPVVEMIETPTAVSTPTYAPNTAVIFKRSGGIAGIDEAWIIFVDGRIETNTSQSPQLTEEKVSQLLSSLETAGFFDLDNTYLPDDTCCDRFFYEITAIQNNAFHTVSTLEATPDMPESLQQSLNLIQNALFADSAQ
ncbi:MAG: hypothetical protein DHS20C20_10210 [Ardenticatenaceae bacterium]|nr:MAG: hypothetical protein DHS20C20_10210 [Ardenticatenaceae bacterium]